MRYNEFSIKRTINTAFVEHRQVAIIRRFLWNLQGSRQLIRFLEGCFRSCEFAMGKL